MLKIPAPRVLPMTIIAIAALLVVKCGTLLEAALTTDHQVQRGLVTIAKAAGVEVTREKGKPAEHAKPAETGGEHGKAAEAPRAEQAPFATAAPEGPPPVSDSERAVLLDLRQRRKELDARAETLAARESMVVAAEQRLTARIAELQSLQKKLEGADAAQKQKEDNGWQGLVKMYEAMKPKDAATIFNDLSMPVLLQVLDRMKDAKAAAVMSAMAPERARDVTAELAQMRTGRNPSAGAADDPSSGG
jgi:flagellar motility protein MotE (MotC chaperone)